MSGSQFVNYTKKVLTYEDRNVLAAALLTIYKEGMLHISHEHNSSDLFWNNHRYSIGLIPDDRSFIVINVRDQSPGPFPLFSVNTNRQAVTWKRCADGVKTILVPSELRPFLVELTGTLHDIHAERTEALELKRKTEEKAKKCYEGIDADKDRMRMMIEGEQVGKAQLQRNLKHKLLRRKVELEDAVRVVHWKASSLELPSVHALDEKATEVGREMLESAKRGPKHDLCAVCGETLRFCTHNGCTIIGCIKCFKDELTMCANCSSAVYCAIHAGDLIECSTCENLVRGGFYPLMHGISDMSLNGENCWSPAASTLPLPKKPKEEEMM